MVLRLRARDDGAPSAASAAPTNGPAEPSGGGRGQRRPVASYGPLLGAYLGLAGGLVLAVRRKRPGSLPHPTAGDVALLGVATFKLSRLIAKEKVLSPVRQPFVERSEAGAGSELNSHPAGTGVRRALGELLTCPFCLSVWIATVLTASYALAPGATRLILAGLGAVAVADASQYGYAGLRQRVA